MAKRLTMRWLEAALAGRGGTLRHGRMLRTAVLAVAGCLGLAGAGAAAPTTPSVPSVTTARAGVFTGYGFEACNAPATEAISAWLASTYRAGRIYIVGPTHQC